MFREIFMTGFPGFLAHMLMQDLLKEGAVIHCLIQEHMLGKARQDREKLLAEMNLEENRIKLYTGCITREKMGLDSKSYEELANTVEAVFHLAAIYDLAVPRELAYQVNVSGTHSVNGFCRDCNKLQRYVYFSTCYVSGDYEGVFRAQDLDKGQGFKNYYEETKFLAEKTVRRTMQEVPTTIIRPAIVVGHSQTGYIPKFDGPYFMMEFACRYRFLPLPYVGQGKAPINLIPVDYLVRATLELIRKNNTEGETFQIADPEPYEANDVYGAVLQEITGKKPGWKLPEKMVRKLHGSQLICQATGLTPEIFSYLNHIVKYDTQKTEKDLHGSGVSCPDLITILPNLIRFFLENRQEKSFFIPARKKVAN